MPRKKLKIPEDFAVIGYNNSILTACCEPELTSIDNKLDTLCRQLITSLMEVLAGNSIPKKALFRENWSNGELRLFRTCLNRFCVCALLVTNPRSILVQ